MGQPYGTAIEPELAIKLSEIYAWTIDFHHLQKGDTFQAVFEEIN